MGDRTGPQQALKARSSRGRKSQGKRGVFHLDIDGMYSIVFSVNVSTFIRNADDNPAILIMSV
jgi:hypothetical protein